MKRFPLRTILVFSIVAGFATPAFAQDTVVDKINKALPEKGPAQPKQPRKILIYSKTAGFRHGSIPVGIKAFTMMGDKTGAYTALASEDEMMFAPEKLKAFDAVLMLNTTLDCLKPKFKKGDADSEKKASEIEEMLKKSLEEFVAGGKGLMGTHSATDTYHNWKAYNKMMGGTFAGHPWNSDSKVAIKNVDPKHPLNAAFDGMDFEIVDEIYQFRADTALPSERRYLITLDPAKRDRGGRKDGLYPISWVSTYEKGRTFYCSLGHNEHIYWNPMVLKHYLAGMQYVLGDFDVDTTPTPQSATRR